ncbi:MAG: hypothetical protein EHM67_03525 [Hyphomicrobiaceae bacterium]|nr:MAG: hypothetical protein EHM67_03525 [Hyphomicrobiaceae bacterium]
MSEEKLKRTIVRDLAKHLDQKIMTAIEDFVDRCGDAEIDTHDAVIQILTVVSHHAAMAGHVLKASEQEFLAVCHHQYWKGDECLTVVQKRVAR